MPMTAAHLAALLAAPHADSLWRGSVLFRRQSQQLQTPETELLDALLAANPSSPTAPAHVNPTRAGIKLNSKPKELGPADLAWLERLSRDPAAITDHDARELAGLAASVAHPSSDARLVLSILEPVRLLHDQRQARAELTAMQALPAVTIPASAVRVVSDALAREHPALLPTEVTARATDLLRTAQEQGAQGRQARLSAAQARADEDSVPA